MWEDLKHNLTYIGLWLTGRGVAAISMLAAIGLAGVNPIVAPAIALPLGLGMASYLSQREANYRRQRTTNSYRNELSATLGKDPKDITVDDLELVANGSRRDGMPLNRVLDERWDNISLRRTLSIASHIIGGIVAGAAVLVLFPEMLGDVFTNAGAMASQTLGVSLDTGTRMVSSLAAGAITFTVDNAVYAGGEYVLGLNKPTMYQHIQDIKRAVRTGQKVSEYDTLNLFVQADQSLAKAVEARFGAPYDTLHERERAYVMELADPVYHVKEITQALNEKRIHGNELAFILDGRRSGVEKKCGTERCDERDLVEIFKGMMPGRERPPAIDHVNTAGISVKHDIAQSVYPTTEEMLQHPAVKTFVERYGAMPPAGNFQDRIAAESALPGLGRIH